MAKTFRSDPQRGSAPAGGSAFIFYVLQSFKPMKYDTRQLLTATVHLLVIGILFILPDMLLKMAFPGRGGSMPWIVYAKSGVMTAVFYINYFFIIPHILIQRRSWWKFIGINIVLIIAATLLLYYLSSAGIEHRPRRRRYQPDAWQLMIASASFMLRDAVMLLLTISLSVVVRMSGRWLELERRQQQLVAARRESELENLRSQLNPHFLFNTLNSIYALIAINPDKASLAVHELSSLLRYVVYENPDSVPLAHEVEFVRNYVDLMCLRLGKRPVNLSVDTDGEPGAHIAPLLLVTLIENAFKHGNTADTSQSIDIDITAAAGTIVCTTRNYTDRPPKPSHTNAGIGLANMRRRLELLYGSRATLSFKCSDDLLCTVSLAIPAIEQSPTDHGLR